MVAKAPLALIFMMIIVSLSGCVQDLSNPFSVAYCSSVGNCQVQDKEAEIKDAIEITGINVMPMAENRIRPGSTVTVYVTLTNKDDNPVGRIDIESIAISDLNIFTCGDGSSAGTCEITGASLVSGQSKAYTFTITAPDNGGTTALPGSMEVSVKYSYSSTRLTTISYLEKDTYIDYVNSHGTTTPTLVNVPSNGPVEVYLDISKIKQPIPYDSANLENYPFNIQITNKGSGEIDNIAEEDLTLEFENGEGIFQDCSAEFSTAATSSGSSTTGTSGTASAISCNRCPTSTSSGTSTSCISNSQAIRMRGNAKPFTYYTVFQPPSDLTFINNGMATTKLRTTVQYDYVLRKRYELLVSPRAEI